MHKFLFQAVAMVLCACPLLAAEEGKVSEAELPKWIVASDPLLSRLALDDKQTKDIEAILAERNGKFKELFKSTQEPKELVVKQREINQESVTKTLSLLDDNQRAKLEAGQAIVKEYTGKMVAARNDNSGEEKIKALKDAMEKTLDEKMGKRREARTGSINQPTPQPQENASKPPHSDKDAGSKP